MIDPLSLLLHSNALMNDRLSTIHYKIIDLVPWHTNGILHGTTEIERWHKHLHSHSIVCQMYNVHQSGYNRDVFVVLFFYFSFFLCVYGVVLIFSGSLLDVYVVVFDVVLLAFYASLDVDGVSMIYYYFQFLRHQIHPICQSRRGSQQLTSVYLHHQ